MRLLFSVLLFLILGCGRGSVKPLVTVPPPLPLQVATCVYASWDAFPAVRVYTDAQGQQFCYDDSEAQADPALLAERWDVAKTELQSIYSDLPAVDTLLLDNLIFKFQPIDGTDSYWGPCFWNTRIPGQTVFNNQCMKGNFRSDSFPLVIDVLAVGFTAPAFGTQPPLAPTIHEIRHYMLWTWKNMLRCSDPAWGLVWQNVGHNNSCDVLLP